MERRLHKSQHLMIESEMTSLIVQSQENAMYYDMIIIVDAQKFSEIDRIGKFFDEGIKIGIITTLVALQATIMAISSDPAAERIKRMMNFLLS